MTLPDASSDPPDGTDDAALDEDHTIVRPRQGRADSGSEPAVASSGEQDPIIADPGDAVLDDDPTVVRRRAEVPGDAVLDDDPTVVRRRVDVPDDDVTVVSGKRSARDAGQVDEDTAPHAVLDEASNDPQAHSSIVSIPIDPSSPLSYERYELRTQGETERGVRRDLSHPATRRRVSVPTIESTTRRRRQRIRWRIVMPIVVGSCMLIGLVLLFVI